MPRRVAVQRASLGVGTMMSFSFPKDCNFIGITAGDHYAGMADIYYEYDDEASSQMYRSFYFFATGSGLRVEDDWSLMGIVPNNLGAVYWKPVL